MQKYMQTFVDEVGVANYYLYLLAKSKVDKRYKVFNDGSVSFAHGLKMTPTGQVQRFQE